MQTSTVNSTSVQQQQKNIEQQVERILAPLRTKPDTGPEMMLQTLQQQPPDIQQALICKLATHYARSNIEHYKRIEQENERLKRPPHQLAILEDVQQDSRGERLAVANTHEGLLEVTISEDVDNKDLIPGHRVALAKNGAVIAVRGLPPACPASEFSKILPDGRILAEEGKQHYILKPGGELCSEKDKQELRPGDLIECEPTTRQAIRVAHRSIRTKEFQGEVPDVSWNDIGGLDNVRATIEEEVLGPILYPETYKPYGFRPPRGILFEGVPGVGKTMLVKATGRALLSTLGLKDNAPILFTVKGTALQSPYVGEGPARIRALAATAKEAATEYGLAIIMLDDFEYGGGLHRGLGDRSSPAYSALTSALISEMDGIDSTKNKMVVWAATVNRSDLLDSALLRAGRFSKKISIPRPGPEACVKILSIHLRDIPISGGLSVEDLAEQEIQRLFSCVDDNLLMRIQYADSGSEEIFPSRIISGAILAEAVRGAALRAIRRDCSNGASRPSGIQLEDLHKSLYEQFNSTIMAVRPSNAHLHYLDLRDDQRVVAVEHVWKNLHSDEETFLT